MILDIYQLLPDGSPDLELRVAEVTLHGHDVSLKCLDGSWQNLLDDLFLHDLVRVLPAGDADGTERLGRGTPEHIQHLIDEELYAFSLAARVRPQ